MVLLRVGVSEGLLSGGLKSLSLSLCPPGLPPPPAPLLSLPQQRALKKPFLLRDVAAHARPVPISCCTRTHAGVAQCCSLAACIAFIKGALKERWTLLVSVVNHFVDRLGPLCTSHFADGVSSGSQETENST